MNLHYREGKIEEIDKLKELGLASYVQFENELTEDNWVKMKVHLSSINFYSDLLNCSTCFVCEDHNELVGMVYLVHKGNPTDIFDKEWCYIRMLGVAPEYSGLGIGKRLIQMCLDFAAEKNEHLIALHTSEFMNAAKYIYEKIGFRAIKELSPCYGKNYWLYLLDLKNNRDDRVSS